MCILDHVPYSRRDFTFFEIHKCYVESVTRSEEYWNTPPGGYDYNMIIYYDVKRPRLTTPTKGIMDFWSVKNKIVTALFTDYTLALTGLKNGGTKLTLIHKVHRDVLAVSPFFETAFRNSLGVSSKELPIDLQAHSITFADFECILEILYTGRVKSMRDGWKRPETHALCGDNTVPNVCNVIRFANFLGILSIVERGCEQLIHDFHLEQEHVSTIQEYGSTKDKIRMVSIIASDPFYNIGRIIGVHTGARKRPRIHVEEVD